MDEKTFKNFVKDFLACLIFVGLLATPFTLALATKNGYYFLLYCPVIGLLYAIANMPIKKVKRKKKRKNKSRSYSVDREKALKRNTPTIQKMTMPKLTDKSKVKK